jgi:predicted acetyltransferase
MEVTLSRGGPLDDQAVRNLFAAYFYEMAAWDPGIELNDAGLPVWTEFGLPGPRTLDECSAHNWWIRDRCLLYAIRTAGSAVGFVIVLEDRELLPEGVDFEVLDFYVAPKARRQGIGEQAARLVLERHHGSAVLFTLKENSRAQAFWRSALRVAATDVAENEDATEFSFRS